MKKVISFSLWGKNPIYTIGAIKNADIAQELYPDWMCWYYVGQSCPKEIIDDLKSRNNTKVIPIPEEGNWSGMFWRFYPASDPNVEAMISRDTDSRLSIREKEAVDEWLVSDKSFHIMRDHPYHATPILGGMWGVKFPKLKDLTKWIDSYTKGEFWQVDQNFLKEVVYDEVRGDCIVHDEFFEGKPFPSKRLGKEFVGMAYTDKNEPLNPEHMGMI